MPLRPALRHALTLGVAFAGLAACDAVLTRLHAEDAPKVLTPAPAAPAAPDKAAPAAADAAAASPAFATESDATVIARVDGAAVTAGEFAPYLTAYLRSKLYHSGSSERKRELAEEAIDAFLVDRVLAGEAAKRAVKIDEAAVEKRIAGLKAHFGQRPEWPQIEARLPKLREEIVKDLQIEALKKEITTIATPTEAEVRAFYDAQHGLFTRPAAYRLRMLLLRVDPGAGAEAWRAAEKQVGEYAQKIAAGEDFSALARAYSKHDSSKEGGAIGLVHEGQLGDAAEAALRPTKAGGIAGPVRLLEGIALFQVDERQEAALMPFADVKERAASLFEREAAKTRWTGHVAGLRSRFTIDRPAFAAFLEKALQ